MKLGEIYEIESVEEMAALIQDNINKGNSIGDIIDLEMIKTMLDDYAEMLNDK